MCAGPMTAIIGAIRDTQGVTRITPWGLSNWPNHHVPNHLTSPIIPCFLA